MARITTFNEEDLTPDELEVVNLKRTIQQLQQDKKKLKDEINSKQSIIINLRNDLTRSSRSNDYLYGLASKRQDIIENGYKEHKFNKEHAGIYRIYNKMTGESYVGQSHVDVYNRCMSHYASAEWPESDWHYDLINNPDNYEYEILKEGVDNQGDLDKLEIYYMGYYHCLDEGYNKAFTARYRFLGLHENEEI